jgi:hypothetical protein
LEVGANVQDRRAFDISKTSPSLGRIPDSPQRISLQNWYSLDSTEALFEKMNLCNLRNLRISLSA